MMYAAESTGAPQTPRSFTVSQWTDAGRASFVAAGADLAALLENGLRAVIALTLPSHQMAGGDRSTPLRGEGVSPAEVFADLAADLLDQLAMHGGSIGGVQIDGVLRRDDGGYVAWGLAIGTLQTIEPDEMFGLSVPVHYERDAAGNHLFTATVQRLVGR